MRRPLLARTRGKLLYVRAPPVPGEPVHGRHPHAAGRRDVYAVAEVARGVGHVDRGRIGKVVLRAPVPAGVRCGDGLDALGKRRVPFGLIGRGRPGKRRRLFGS